MSNSRGKLVGRRVPSHRLWFAVYRPADPVDTVYCSDGSWQPMTTARNPALYRRVPAMILSKGLDRSYVAQYEPTLPLALQVGAL